MLLSWKQTSTKYRYDNNCMHLNEYDAKLGNISIFYVFPYTNNAHSIEYGIQTSLPGLNYTQYYSLKSLEEAKVVCEKHITAWLLKTGLLSVSLTDTMLQMENLDPTITKSINDNDDFWSLFWKK